MAQTTRRSVLGVLASFVLAPFGFRQSLAEAPDFPVAEELPVIVGTKKVDDDLVIDWISTMEFRIIIHDCSRVDGIFVGFAEAPPND